MSDALSYRVKLRVGTTPKALALRGWALRGLLLLCFIIGSGQLFAETPASDPIQLNVLGQDEKPAQWLSALEDPQQQWSIRDFLQDPQKFDWQLLDTDVPNFGYIESAVWLKFSIVNPHTTKQLRLLSVAYPVLDQVDLFLYSHDQIIQHISSGDFVPAKNRPFQHRDFIFELELTPQSETQVIMLSLIHI